MLRFLAAWVLGLLAHCPTDPGKAALCLVNYVVACDVFHHC